MVLKWIFITLLCNSIFGTTRTFANKPYYDIESADALFADFVNTHNKSYDSEEYKKRFNIFVETLKTINKLNEEYETVTFGINAYSDRTFEEKVTGLGLRPNKDQSQLVDFPDMVEDIPEFVDWREKNVVNPIKYQDGCGSCWAFSAVAVIESQQAINHKKLLSLSEQQIVDCDYDDFGCSGGFPIDAFTYAAQTGGMMLESDYPYVHEDGDCNFDPKKVVVKVINGTLYKPLTEVQMAELVANYGPISVGIQFTYDLSCYKSGVIIPKDCGKKDIDNINHAVAFIGYGTENGSPYWLIRNSWGITYGDKGYFKLYRGKALCSITEAVSTVKIE